jgi:hypothetical protein
MVQSAPAAKCAAALRNCNVIEAQGNEGGIEPPRAAAMAGARKRERWRSAGGGRQDVIDLVYKYADVSAKGLISDVNNDCDRGED